MLFSLAASGFQLLAKLLVLTSSSATQSLQPESRFQVGVRSAAVCSCVLASSSPQLFCSSGWNSRRLKHPLMPR